MTKYRNIEDDYDNSVKYPFCAWWANCPYEANWIASHTILGDVFICDRCKNQQESLENI